MEVTGGYRRCSGNATWWKRVTVFKSLIEQGLAQDEVGSTGKSRRGRISVDRRGEGLSMERTAEQIRHTGGVAVPRLLNDGIQEDDALVEQVAKLCYLDVERTEEGRDVVEGTSSQRAEEGIMLFHGAVVEEVVWSLERCREVSLNDDQRLKEAIRFCNRVVVLDDKGRGKPRHATAVEVETVAWSHEVRWYMRNDPVKVALERDGRAEDEVQLVEGLVDGEAETVVDVDGPQW
jgi:hypothetical protein